MSAGEAASRRPGEDAEVPSRSVDCESQPTGLDALEQELTQQVPQLLEIMNRTSYEVNEYELQLAQARKHYRSLLAQWGRLYEELRGQHGTAIDRLRPYFDAAQVLDEANRRVQAVVKDFSAAAALHAQAKQELCRLEDALEELARGGGKVSLDTKQQDELARATVRVLKCQQERDHREEEYAKALQGFQDAQKNLEAWRVQIGDAVIKRALPSCRLLQQHQSTLGSEQARIRALVERVRLSKVSYHNSLRELDKISTAVHDLRREHKEAAVSGSQASSCLQQGGGEDRRPLELCPLPPTPPEEAPEAKTPAGASAGSALAVGRVGTDNEELDENLPELVPFCLQSIDRLEERLGETPELSPLAAAPAETAGALAEARARVLQVEQNERKEIPPELSPEGRPNA